jgi:sporulation protein YlmC with PRC-barrel domain
MKFFPLAAASVLALAGLSAPALAAPTVGATVYGPDGNEVGKIEQVTGGNVVIDTGNLKAAIPADTVSDGEKGPTIGWNKADLEAAAGAANAEAGAALEAKLVGGTDVYSSDGVVLGKVNKVEGDLVVVDLKDGATSLPKKQMAVQADKLTFLATAADVEAALAAQGGD